MPVVVVESPAKAKTINKYLGPGYTVLASYGHVRDLPPKDGSVATDDDFAMKWEVAADSKKHIKAIADALKTDDELILATDPDREGEAISWHLQEALASSIKKGKKVSRVAFNAITKPAILAAMEKPRDVDTALVEAYLARRALDYLVGFNLSPVLWRKLPGARSAGRVQSVVLRLVVEREMEIEAFNPREYWSVSATLTTPRGQEVEARLSVYAGKKLDKFDLATREAADLAVAAIDNRSFSVRAVEAKPATRNPFPPFMTSTLQQEASRKFGMGSKATMAAAQRLYEAGHITYMRTDGIDMAPEAVTAAREAIKDLYGAPYVPDSPRIYKNKAKNAQEAHECIRPTVLSARPESLKITDTDQRRLYELIWKRTIASQMASARMERTTVDFASQDGQVELRATGQVVQFDGFLRVYDEGRDDEEGEDSARLPQLMQGETMQPAKDARRPDYVKGAEFGTPPGEATNMVLGKNGSALALQHHTQPPPRYTEATLIKRMEELGIGRPSTYTSIVTTIQDREYVTKDRNRLIPSDKGRLVTAFLTNFFRRYVEYDFTADLEAELDDVSAGDRAWKDVLARFWRDFSAAIGETTELRISEVLEKLDDFLSPHLYPPRADGSDPRSCPTCGSGRLHLKTARSGGAFIGCGNYPECRYTRPISVSADDPAAALDGKVLGTDDFGVEVTLRNGRFGPYVQKGEATADVPKPPRASLPKGWAPDQLTYERALELLSLPRQIGPHPEDGEMIEAALGRFGPYVKHGKVYANLADAEEVFTIGMNRAVEVLAQKAARGAARGAAAEPLRSLGEHPDGGEMQVMPGRYGPYIKWGKVNATLPKDSTPEEITAEQAIELVNARAVKKPARKTAAKPKAETAKKPAAKKTAAKKPAAAKATGTKTAAKKKTAAKAAEDDGAVTE